MAGRVRLTAERSARTARRFLRRYLLPLYRQAGHRVQAILTDGGSEFRGAFDHACAALGIEHRRTRPRHAWTNGFVERLQGGSRRTTVMRLCPSG